MTQQESSGKETGVWIAARNIVNEGSISSEGPDAKTTIISDHLDNPGEIINKDTKQISRKWWKDSYIVVPAIIAILGIIITTVVTVMY